MENTSIKHKIFISFSFHDSEFAKALADYLIKIIGEENFELYCVALKNNTNSAVYGTDFCEDFIQNVRECSFFIPLLSHNYKHSISSIIELGAAIGTGKTIAPLLLPYSKYKDFDNFYNLRNRDYYSIEDLDGIRKLLELLGKQIKFKNTVYEYTGFICTINDIKKKYIPNICEVSHFSFKCDSYNEYNNYTELISNLNKSQMIECAVLTEQNGTVYSCEIHLKRKYRLLDFVRVLETLHITNYNIIPLEQL